MPSCQSRNRRQHVIPELQFISCGGIRQGIPLRSMNNTPLRQSRSDKRGLPPFAWTPGLGEAVRSDSTRRSLNAKGSNACVNPQGNCAYFLVFLLGEI